MDTNKTFLHQQGAAALPPSYSSAPPAFRTTFGSLSLHEMDKLRLIQFSSADISMVRETIKRVWSSGIQAERTYSVSHEFKLRGTPWTTYDRGTNAVQSMILMREIFASLYSAGWILTASTDISRKISDKDTLLFRKQPVPPPTATWVTISFKSDDKLRFLGAPPELLNAFASTFSSNRVLRSHAAKDSAANYYQFNLMGYPWRAHGEDTMRARLLILQMVELLETHGWSLYASIDQKSSTSDSSYGETDVWYCIKSADWVPGSIVLHH